MKKILTNHKFTQKIFLTIVMVLLFSFAVPVKSQAGIGGLLLDPLFDLLGTVLDVVGGALQAFLVDGEWNNSKDSSGLNFYLADIKDFQQRVASGDKSYEEFKYNEDSKTKKEFNADDLDKGLWGNSTYAIPMIKYTPEKIFSGRIPALDINFVNPKDWESEEMNERSVSQALHGTIAEWYVSLRNLTVVGLMLVLVYVGIRIVISSTASDKAKYKQMLMDWLIAMCLVFCLHYIMTFTTTIVGEITSAISGGIENNGNNIAVTVTGGSSTSNNTTAGDNPYTGGPSAKIYCARCHREITKNANYNPTGYGDTSNPANEYIHVGINTSADRTASTTYCKEEIITSPEETTGSTTEGTGNNTTTTTTTGNAVQFNTDLMGLIRFQMQYNDVGSKLLYLIFYIAMVIYTCMFTFYYLRRVLTMAFLTLIAPVVALTYPIDKIRDGKAQAFDMWLKEYIFNALLQPFHLIIYSIFVGSAIDLAANNPIYAIVALAFITPAEKILRKFFGFEKASTAGALGAVAGVAGGAAAMNMARSLMAPKKGGGGSKGSKGPRTRQRTEGDVPSLGESLRGNSNGSDSQSLDDRRERMLEAYDEGFGTDSYDPTEREAMVREIAQPEGMNYSADEYANILRDSGYGADDISSMVNDRYGALSESTLEVPVEEPLSVTSGITSDEATQSSSAPIRISNSGTASTSSTQGTSQSRPSLRDGARRFTGKIPKPIKGVANVVGRTGLSVGKAALKAAPGAVFGMAAGIAGDELGDITKYTVAGAALSSTIGSSAVTQAGRFIGDAYRDGAHGTDSDIIARQQKEYVKSKEWDDVYRHEFKREDGSELSSAELKAKKQQGAYYDSRGIQGEDAIKAVKLEDKIKKEIGQDREEFDAQSYTARIMKIAKPYSADKLRKESEVQNLTNSITKEIMKGGLDQSAAAEQAKVAVKYIKQAKGIKE